MVWKKAVIEERHTRGASYEVGGIQMKSTPRLVWTSLKRAFQVITFLYLLISLCDIFVGDQRTPLLQRVRLAWVLYWPKLLLSQRPEITDRDLLVSLSVDLVVFSTAIFFTLWLRTRRQTTLPRGEL